jgi:hypothetical protein
MRNNIKIYFYKGIRPGLAGVYSHGVRIVTGSIYSHCEILFSDGESASSSFSDKGVRFKKIEYDPKNWDYIELPAELFEEKARKWFEEHKGDKYDLLGNVQFLFSVIPEDKKKWFCSEAVGKALGLPSPWRFDPGTLHATLTLLSNTVKQIDEAAWDAKMISWGLNLKGV